MKYVLTIDAGTSAFKLMLWDHTGCNIHRYSEELDLLTRKTDFVEISPEHYWQVIQRGIAHILQASAICPADIQAIAISSHGETLINLDSHGKPLRNAIVWTDNRSVDEAGIIAAEFGPDRIHAITGQPEVVPTWPATKILWQKRNQPEIFSKTVKFLLPEDYLLFQLTGKYIGEYSVHSSSLWLDINNHCLWSDMLEFLGLESDRFSQLSDSGRIIGTVSQEAAGQTGLSPDTLVATGALDQAAGAIGAGSIEAGICSETTGSALAACVLVDKPLTRPEHKIPCHCHALEDKYYLMAWSQTAGLVLKWFKDNFCGQELSESQTQNKNVYDLLDRLAEQVPPGSEGLICLPHLTGAACPEFNPNARGVFFNISLHHGKAHFIRAIMESVAYMLKTHINLLKKMGADIGELRSTGGGSRSQLWTQIKADALGLPVAPALTTEAASVGVAILAAVAAGIFKDVGHGCRTMVGLKQAALPRPENYDAYRKGFQTYQRLYDSLCPLFGA